jgi:hypothetical protein
MKTASRIIRMAAPIAVILVGFTAMAAYAGTGDMGVLSGIQVPAGQAQNAVIFLGVIACVVGMVGAWIMWLRDHNLGVSIATFLGCVLATVGIKNVVTFIGGMAGTGASF